MSLVHECRIKMASMSFTTDRIETNIELTISTNYAMTIDLK